MKKVLAFLTAALMTAALTAPAMAADVPADGRGDYSAAEALNIYWEYYENIPDYSSGFWLDEDGVLTVGLVDEAGRDEVLAIVGDAKVNFVRHTYSYNELMAIQEELTLALMELDLPIVTIGVNVMDNVTEVGLNTEDPGAAGFMAELTVRYGDRVAFRDMTGMVVEFAAGTKPAVNTELLPKDSGVPTPLIVVCIAGLCGAFWILAQGRRMARQAQTVDGQTFSAAPATRKETEAAVKNTVAQPDTTLRDIVEKLEK